jgi:hypothetical protein
MKMVTEYISQNSPLRTPDKTDQGDFDQQRSMLDQIKKFISLTKANQTNLNRSKSPENASQEKPPLLRDLEKQNTSSFRLEKKDQTNLLDKLKTKAGTFTGKRNFHH